MVIHHEMQAHITQLVNQTDAYALGNYDDAFRLERESYAHMFPLARCWQPVSWRAPICRFQQTSIALLVRPVEAGDGPWVSMRSWPWMPCGQDSRVCPICGRRCRAGREHPRAHGRDRERVRAGGAGSFQSLWSDHIDAFVTYTRALATGEPRWRARRTPG